MRTEIKNGVYTISDDNSSVKLTQEEALKLAKMIFETAKDDFSTIKVGDHIWYADADEHILEEGEIVNVERNDRTFEVKAFGVHFIESNDFDEFNGCALGDCFFLSKEIAALRMNFGYPGAGSRD